MSTVVELRKEAKEKGLKGYSKMKKAELIELLKEGEKKGEKKDLKIQVRPANFDGQKVYVELNSFGDNPIVIEVIDNKIYFIGEVIDKKLNEYKNKKIVRSGIKFFDKKGASIKELNDIQTKSVKKPRMKRIKDIVMRKEDEGGERTIFINKYLDVPFVYQILNGEVYIVGEAQERDYGGFDVIKDYKKKVPSNVRFYNPRGKPIEKLNELMES